MIAMRKNEAPKVRLEPDVIAGVPPRPVVEHIDDHPRRVALGFELAPFPSGIPDVVETKQAVRFFTLDPHPLGRRIRPQDEVRSAESPMRSMPSVANQTPWRQGD